MPYFIASPCIDVMDKSCIEECPVDCIYEGDRKLYINPRECIDCGACEPACPEGAIFTDFKAPPEMAQFVEDNQRFFAESLDGRDEPIGSPGRQRESRPRRRRHRTRAVLARCLSVSPVISPGDLCRRPAGRACDRGPAGAIERDLCRGKISTRVDGQRYNC